MKRASHTLVTLAVLTTGIVSPVHQANAQHVTAAMAATMVPRTGPPGCEDRAREAAKILDVLDANLERARQTSDKAQMRAAADAAQKGFVDLKGRLDACRAGAPAAPGAAPATGTAGGGAMAGMDHSKMKLDGTKPP
ncbi:MAG: hypothetical protein H0W08_18895, partial [Acidobacteria bacterium]|nr:hypothetical protein [Acidobacteriota bacterium]